MLQTHVLIWLTFWQTRPVAVGRRRPTSGSTTHSQKVRKASVCVGWYVTMTRMFCMTLRILYLTVSYWYAAFHWSVFCVAQHSILWYTQETRMNALLSCCKIYNFYNLDLTMSSVILPRKTKKCINSLLHLRTSCSQLFQFFVEYL